MDWCHLSSRALLHVIKWQLDVKHIGANKRPRSVLGYVSFCQDYGVTVIVST
jgi:hypothetical protein